MSPGPKVLGFSQGGYVADVTVLVTGGSGCLGSPLVRLLAGRGVRVRVLCIPGDQALHLRDVEVVSFECGTLADGEVLRRVCEGVEVVYHLAGKVHEVPRSMAEEREFYEVNVRGTADLLAAARSAGVKRVVFYSSVAVYGEGVPSGADETASTDPKTINGRSKLEAEIMVLSESSVEGVVLRFPVAYGPRDQGNVERLIQAVARKRFFWVGEGRNRKSLVGAENAAAAAVLAGAHPEAKGQVFIITDGSSVSLAELVSAINAALGQTWKPPSLPRSVAQGTACFGSWIADLLGFSVPLTKETYPKLFGTLEFSSAKAEHVLGYRPVLSLSDGIREEVSWMRSVGMLKAR